MRGKTRGMFCRGIRSEFYYLLLFVQVFSTAGSALISDFSVQPLCLCASVVMKSVKKTTTETQRHRGCTEKKLKLGHYPAAAEINSTSLRSIDRRGCV